MSDAYVVTKMVECGTVAYLGFWKGGVKFSLATSAHTKEGAIQVFQFFFNVKKKISGQRGAMAQWPP